MVRETGRVATFVSYRFGGTDGVAIESAKWMRALETLGFTTRRIAGELLGPPQNGDVVVPWLALQPSPGVPGPDPDAFLAMVDADDLIVVENVCSLPLNLGAARAVAATLGRTRARVVLHHHDLPWQRPETEQVTDLPPRILGALHVTINARARDELASRGIEAVEITNAFDVGEPADHRLETRRSLGFDDAEIVVLQPARAIPRKNVPAALRFAEELATIVAPQPLRFWLTGPAEDGYEPVLDELLLAARVPTTLGLGPGPADAYAAADVVVFPSTVEGFGNPVIESVIARRPLVVGHYPVLDEILAHGFELFRLDEPEVVAKWLADPDPALLDRNVERARRSYAIEDLPVRIGEAFREHGWTSW
ncbi:MAG: glycosyltransferase [Acidimicrobiia bacterium]